MLVNLRKLKTSDVLTLVAYESEFIKEEPFSERDLLDRFRSVYFGTVIEVDGKLAGYCLVNTETNVVERLFIHPALRRKHLGRALLCFTIGSCNFGTYFAYVNEYALDVQLFLKSLGWEATLTGAKITFEIIA